MSTIKSKFISAPINGSTVEPLILQTNNIDRVSIDSNGVLNVSNGQITKDASGNVGISGNLGAGLSPDANSVLALRAGTTSLAPLKLTSGTSLSTATAGVIEYDGRVIYATPQGTQRGVVPSQMFFRLNAVRTGSNATGAQSVFGVGVTLAAGTVYEFDGLYYMTKSAGATSHTFSVLFGGTATINNIAYQTVTHPNNTAGFVGGNTAVTAIAVTGAIAIAGAALVVRIRGTVSINAGGTFIPQYSLSAAPGGAYSTIAGSYFKISPVGAAGADINVGGFA
jgi:hypothetical protein